VKPPTADLQATTTIADGEPAQAPDPTAPKKTVVSPRQDRDAPIESTAPRPDKGIETTPVPTTHLQAAVIEARLSPQSSSLPGELAASTAAQSSGVITTPTSTVITNAPLNLANLTVLTGMAVPLSGLAVEISANARIGNSRFEIRLDPPDLGRIDVRLDVDRTGQVTSRLFVEKSETLDLLRRDAPQLQQALQDAGLKTADNSLQFSLRDQSPHGRDDNGGTGQNAQLLVIAEDETLSAENAGRSYSRSLSASGGVDIRV